MTRDRRRITRMIAAFIKRDPGAQARIAALLDEPESTVAHWFSDDGARQYRMPVDALPAVVDALDRIEIYAAIVAENGLTAPLPRARPTTSPAPLLESMGALLRAAGDLGSEICAAGSEIDADEAERIFSVGMRARAEIDAMLARLPRRST